MARPRRKKHAPASTGAASSQQQESPWRRLVVDVGNDAAEAVSAVLLEAGSLGIELEDDETRAVPGRAFAPTGRATVIATFSREPGLEARASAALAQVAPHFESARSMEVSWSDLYAEDWNAAFKAQWKPLAFTPRTWVVPSWEAASFTPPGGALPIVVDPGLAFGTGTHQTTRLCALALDDALARAPIELLLDVGTGSGILSVCALLLGAERARGTDVDPVAVRAALENAAKNGVAERFEASDALPDAWGAVHDAVVANILAEPLLLLAPAIARALAPGGRLWLSGLLVEQGPAIARAYQALGLVVDGEARDEGWLRLDLHRPRRSTP